MDGTQFHYTVYLEKKFAGKLKEKLKIRYYTIYMAKTTPLQVEYINDDYIEVGIDEAGRGPMFGRVYAAAVVYNPLITLDKPAVITRFLRTISPQVRMF